MPTRSHVKRPACGQLSAQLGCLSALFDLTVMHGVGS